MKTCSRRVFIGVVPFTALSLAGCTKQTEGPEEIHYGRETCTMCGMIISDAHYATEIRGAADRKLSKFDDIGCAVHWLQIAKLNDAAIFEFWVMNSEDGATWLDARKAHYLAGAVTPMDYGYAAVDAERPDLVTFEKMRSTVVAMGLSSRCPPPSESNA